MRYDGGNIHPAVAESWEAASGSLGCPRGRAVCLRDRSSECQGPCAGLKDHSPSEIIFLQSSTMILYKISLVFAFLYLEQLFGELPTLPTHKASFKNHVRSQRTRSAVSAWALSDAE